MLTLSNPSSQRRGAVEKRDLSCRAGGRLNTTLVEPARMGEPGLPIEFGFGRVFKPRGSAFNQ